MSPATLQTLIAALLVAVAAFFIGRRVYRTFAKAKAKDDGSCGGDCCGS